MSLLTLGGLIGGIACVVISIMMDGDIMSFVNLPSIFVVLGGLAASTIMSFPGKQLKNVFNTTKIAYSKERTDIAKSINMIIEMANSARKEGLLSLDSMAEEIEDPYLRKGIMLVVDGSDPELVKSVMETEIGYMEARHNQTITVFSQMAAYSPAFGMLGTLIGLVNMLLKLDDPSTIGPSMAVAIVTTFYGVILANMIFTPIAKKLKAYSENEQLQKEIILEGILSIQDGENPRIIRDKLEAFLAHMDIKAYKTPENEEQPQESE